MNYQGLENTRPFIKKMTIACIINLSQNQGPKATLGQTHSSDRIARSIAINYAFADNMILQNRAPPIAKKWEKTGKKREKEGRKISPCGCVTVALELFETQVLEAINREVVRFVVYLGSSMTHERRHPSF